MRSGRRIMAEWKGGGAACARIEMAGTPARRLLFRNYLR